MSNRRPVTLFLIALALVIQVLGALLLETSKPPSSTHHVVAAMSSQASWGLCM